MINYYRWNNDWLTTTSAHSSFSPDVCVKPVEQADVLEGMLTDLVKRIEVLEEKLAALEAAIGPVNADEFL